MSANAGFKRHISVKFNEFSRISKIFLQFFEDKVYEKYRFKCKSSTSEMLDWINGEISTID